MITFLYEVNKEKSLGNEKKITEICLHQYKFNEQIFDNVIRYISHVSLEENENAAQP